MYGLTDSREELRFIKNQDHIEVEYYCMALDCDSNGKKDKT